MERGLLPVAALLTLPGLAVMALLPASSGWGPGHRLLAAPGTSLAVIALLFEGAWAVGLRLDATAMFVLLGVSAPVAAWALIRRPSGPAPQPRLSVSTVLLPALFLVILGLTAYSRFAAISGIAVPLWWDSVHHTTIVQLLLDNGGIFSSWQPYVPLSTFTYHFGFHAATAAAAWLTGLTAPAAVLIFGQVLNVAAVPVGYLLAARLTGRPWAGVVAALVTGLVSLTPAYYVNWGRYTQLAGQIILPVAMLLLMEAVETGGWRRVLLAAVAAAGLALTHYRVAVFFGAFVLAYLLVRVYQRWGRWSALAAEIGRVITVAAAAFLLVAPWAYRLFNITVPRYLERWLGPVAPSSAEWLATYNSLRDVDPILPPYILWPTLAGLALGLVLKQRAAFLLVLWVEGLFLSANPGWLGLPGTGEITNHAVLIGLYLPASCAIGLLVALVLDRARRLAVPATALAAALTLIIASWGALESAKVVNPFFQLVTPADLNAFDWIRQNTPSTARFLVNSERAYNDTTVVGTDAGWWLPLLAHRQNNVPPMIYASERSLPPGFAERTNDLEEIVRTGGATTPPALAALRSAGITHVFVGSRGGYLKPDELIASPDYQPLYDVAGAGVFALRPAP